METCHKTIPLKKNATTNQMQWHLRKYQNLTSMDKGNLQIFLKTIDKTLCQNPWDEIERRAWWVGKNNVKITSCHLGSWSPVDYNESKYLPSSNKI